ncbi:hypothetical protein [Streptomyces sp. DSM 40907]|uniref:hypothetical protein n=1 Tax=Streptomyces kutzneri TaxID=3051179 RepID=UPI0028D1D02B|nr:hypothetical protein [Streptomyces sp. DSM 40907]
MAFECGVLGRSGGQTARESLADLLAHLLAEDPDVSHDSVKEGEGWAASRIRVARSGEAILEQYLQVSVGGEIVDFYLDSAREVLGEGGIQGMDLMLTTILSGMVDPVINDRIAAYALAEWHGVPWDETSGFTASAPCD